ncbi:hypothetical protein HK405_003493 [Cladochytrium tenue]|nr:hypothetical protein HK405_003493 [Cladochytrium tenue]
MPLDPRSGVADDTGVGPKVDVGYNDANTVSADFADRPSADFSFERSPELIAIGAGSSSPPASPTFLPRPILFVEGHEASARVPIGATALNHGLLDHSLPAIPPAQPPFSADGPPPIPPKDALHASTWMQPDPNYPAPPRLDFTAPPPASVLPQPTSPALHPDQVRPASPALLGSAVVTTAAAVGPPPPASRSFVPNLFAKIAHVDPTRLFGPRSPSPSATDLEHALPLPPPPPTATVTGASIALAPESGRPLSSKHSPVLAPVVVPATGPAADSAPVQATTTATNSALVPGTAPGPALPPPWPAQTNMQPPVPAPFAKETAQTEPQPPFPVAQPPPDLHGDPVPLSSRAARRSFHPLPTPPGDPAGEAPPASSEKTKATVVTGPAGQQDPQSKPVGVTSSVAAPVVPVAPTPVAAERHDSDPAMGTLAKIVFSYSDEEIVPPMPSPYKPPSSQPAGSQPVSEPPMPGMDSKEKSQTNAAAVGTLSESVPAASSSVSQGQAESVEERAPASDESAPRVVVASPEQITMSLGRASTEQEPGKAAVDNEKASTGQPAQSAASHTSSDPAAAAPITSVSAAPIATSLESIPLPKTMDEWHQTVGSLNLPDPAVTLDRQSVASSHFDEQPTMQRAPPALPPGGPGQAYYPGFPYTAPAAGAQPMLPRPLHAPFPPAGVPPQFQNFYPYPPGAYGGPQGAVQPGQLPPPGAFPPGVYPPGIFPPGVHPGAAPPVVYPPYYLPHPGAAAAAVAPPATTGPTPNYFAFQQPGQVLPPQQQQQQQPFSAAPGPVAHPSMASGLPPPQQPSSRPQSPAAADAAVAAQNRPPPPPAGPPPPLAPSSSPRAMQSASPGPAQTAAAAPDQHDALLETIDLDSVGAPTFSRRSTRRQRVSTESSIVDDRAAAVLAVPSPQPPSQPPPQSPPPAGARLSPPVAAASKPPSRPQSPSAPQQPVDPSLDARLLLPTASHPDDDHGGALSAATTQARIAELRATAKKERRRAEQRAAQFALARCLVEDSDALGPAEHDRAKIEAFDLLKKLSRAGMPDAQFYLGKAYAEDKKYDAAAPLFLKAARQSHPAACHALASCYENGLGVKKNTRSAAEYYRLAATAGNDHAMYRVGIAFLSGDVGFPFSPKEGVKWLKRCAASETSATLGPALLQLAVLHERGLPPDIPVDPRAALSFLSEAARANYPPALTRLARAYEAGRLGLTVDLPRALSLYSRAANPPSSSASAGAPRHPPDPDALVALSDLHLHGVPAADLPASERRAVDFARAALHAQPDHPGALYALGYFAGAGIGGKRDPAAAVDLYRRAAAGGSKLAAARLRELGVDA